VKTLKLVPAFFLLIALYLASGVTVFANIAAVSQSTSEEEHSFQTDANLNALFIEEIGPTEVFQLLSENNPSFDFVSTGADSFRFSNKKGSLNIVSVPVRDQRRLISQYIFPFHFFW
jgi:hypothetical protein